MHIKMIVCDLDGTLLRADGSISGYTLKVLERCRKMSIKITVATARNKFMSEKIVNIINPDAVITNGGAFAGIGNEIVYSCCLDQADANNIVKKLLKRGHITRISAEGKNFYLENLLTEFSGSLPHGVHKINARIGGESLGDFCKDMPDVHMLKYRDEDLVRFAHKNAGKMYAVQAVADYMGINIKEIVAFGDDLIDIEMLKDCGIGVAVANAVDEVKAAADCICGSNDEDGVAKWLDSCLGRL